MTMARWFKHLTMTQWQLRRAFPEPVLQAITAAVRSSEQRHGGEIRVAIEGDWPASALWRGVSARQRAVQVFAELQVWDTHANNGVLIYLNLAERQVEIVADRGLAPFIAQNEWDGVCQALQTGLALGQYQQVLCRAVEHTGELIARGFPVADRNEQSDRPILL